MLVSSFDHPSPARQPLWPWPWPDVGDLGLPPCPWRRGGGAGCTSRTRVDQPLHCHSRVRSLVIIKAGPYCRTCPAAVPLPLLLLPRRRAESCAGMQTQHHRLTDHRFCHEAATAMAASRTLTYWYCGAATDVLCCAVCCATMCTAGHTSPVPARRPAGGRPRHHHVRCTRCSRAGQLWSCPLHSRQCRRQRRGQWRCRGQWLCRGHVTGGGRRCGEGASGRAVGDLWPATRGGGTPRRCGRYGSRSEELGRWWHQRRGSAAEAAAGAAARPGAGPAPRSRACACSSRCQRHRSTRRRMDAGIGGIVPDMRNAAED